MVPVLGRLLQAKFLHFNMNVDAPPRKSAGSRNPLDLTLEEVQQAHHWLPKGKPKGAWEPERGERKGKVPDSHFEPGFQGGRSSQALEADSIARSVEADVLLAFHGSYMGPDCEQEHQSLCALVKRMQRTSEKLCFHWWNWCQLTSNGWRDPKWHSLESLRNFFLAVEMGNVPNLQLPVEQNWWHKELVRRVKEGQRQSQDFKSQWWRYCDSFGNAVRDPGRHERRFIETFLAHWDNKSINSLYCGSDAGMRLVDLPEQSVDL